MRWWVALVTALALGAGGAGDGPARAQTAPGPRAATYRAMQREGSAPRLARLSVDAASGRELAGAKLDEAAAYPSCLTGAFDPPTAVYCPVTADDARAGYLVQGAFDVAWVDGACDEPDAALAEFMTAVPEVRAGGHVVCTATGAEPDRRRFAGVADNGLFVTLPRSADGAALVDELMQLPGETVPQGGAESAVELARSAPVVAVVGDRALHVQGTFELRDDDPRRPAIPNTRGHLYAFAAEQVPSADAAFSRIGAPVFDAAEGIPTASPDGCASWFTGGCRTVFANAEAGARPAVRFVTRDAAAGLGLRAALVERVLSARLGGVDRSTPAVIQSSPRAGEQRPTMIYAGALDGMLHAFCAEPGGACRAAGQELWAFLPRAQLASLARGTQRIDGSPRVADVFGDFDGDGQREWRTVLAFQTGGGEPAVYALDVTDPAAPELLWDVPAPGAGLGVALGPVRTGASPANRVFAQTSAPGGVSVQAIDAVTGEVVWTWAAAGGPAEAIPAGVSAVDLDNAGAITHLVAPTPAGEVWLLRADTGEGAFGDAPLFRFSTDGHPIGAAAAIYADRDTRQLRALIVSGGYAAAVDTGAVAADQYLVAIPLKLPAGVAPPLDETSEQLVFAAELEPGRRGYAQPTVAGNELFVVTDTGDVNLDSYGAGEATGELTRYGLADGERIDAPVAIAGGASPVDVTRDGVVHTGSATAVRTVDYSANFDPDGLTTELVFKAQTGRQVWLKLR